MTGFGTFQVCGVVESVNVTTRGARGFRVAEILLHLDDESAVQVEATHERVGAAQRLAVGDVVLISGFVRSRRGADRWFTALSAGVIATATGSQVGKPSRGPAPSASALPPEDPGPPAQDPAEDNRPF
jgi:hypothetical protein